LPISTTNVRQLWTTNILKHTNALSLIKGWGLS
jgi:hypothetical protein